MIQAELAAIAEWQPVPSWAGQLSDDRELRDKLYDGLAYLHGRLLAPYWTGISSRCAADRTIRVRQFLTGGVERLLREANPVWMRWRPPILEIRNRVDFDLYLEGQGILLVPTMFATRSIVSDDSHAQSQPTVTYPLGHDQPLDQLTCLAPKSPISKLDPAVSALLGHTRAAVLDAIAEHPGCNTKELAAFTGIAPASASEHATTLREAGLIGTVRYRNAALHSATALGIALLNIPNGSSDSPG
ncbi:winged helix-turn-helix domain-containing protein [Streptomyces sp. NPDC020800]|uniref:winged helix-turn-helix domain-containing protein n=1 Tax=Streptomyces sp. NPDC020800 TaxID=3365092 RepID=UPI003792BE0E